MKCSRLYCYPNPFRDRVFLTTTISDPYTLKVTDMLGRFIESFQVNENTFQYSLTLASDKKGVTIQQVITPPSPLLKEGESLRKDRLIFEYMVNTILC